MKRLAAVAVFALALAACGKTETPAAPADKAASTPPAADATKPPEPEKKVAQGADLCPLIRKAYVDIIRPPNSEKVFGISCEVSEDAKPGTPAAKITVGVNSSKNGVEELSMGKGDPAMKAAPEFGEHATQGVWEADKDYAHTAINTVVAGHMTTLDIFPGKPIDDGMMARIKVDTMSLLDAIAAPPAPPQ